MFTWSHAYGRDEASTVSQKQSICLRPELHIIVHNQSVLQLQTVKRHAQGLIPYTTEAVPLHMRDRADMLAIRAQDWMQPFTPVVDGKHGDRDVLCEQTVDRTTGHLDSCHTGDYC